MKTHPPRRPRSSLRWPLAALGVIACTLLIPTSATAQQCVPQLFVQPTGVSADPGENFQPLEHHLMHSSTHLQGTPAAEKFAAAIHLPGQSSSLSDMRTVVIVNNPSATLPLNVTIEYIDPAGVLLAASAATIAPEGHYQELATPLTGQPWGTVRIFKDTDADPDFVGATIFHTYTIGRDPGTAIPGNTGDPTDAPEPIKEVEGEGEGEYEYFRQSHLTRVGAASMQQLQMQQDYAFELFWGPLPLTNNAGPLSWDFLEGNSPLMMVTNPNPFPTTISVLQIANNGFLWTPYNVTLAPFASWVDMGFFNNWLNAHTNAVPYDVDAMMWVTSDDGPILGQGVLFDFFGPNMSFLQRFRMGSTMMSNERETRLVASELVSETGPIATNTLIGIANSSFGDIGPIEIEYRDRNGTITGLTTIPNFPILSTLRIGPGSPNYPLTEFAGSVTIRSCQPGLIGWSMRSTEHPGVPGPQSVPPIGNSEGYTVNFELRKAWGEVLDGGNGSEPGDGFPVSNADGLVRKIGPLNLVRNTTTNTRPFAGYNTVFNDGVSNVGPYSYRTFISPGNEITDFTLQPFAGLSFGDSSFTYLDNTIPLVANGNLRTFVNTKFEHVFSRASGVNALGDFTWQWPWETQVFIPPPGGGAPYAGPGDVVPNQ